MAGKSKKTKTQKNTIPEAPENVLPQNILPIGERVEESKNVYISQAVFKEIHGFTQNKTTNESGGMLIGYIIEEFGKTNIIIDAFVEAKYCEATPTTLTFTHETWEYVHTEIDKKHNGKKIVGWIHTHPDFGIFLSEYDRFIHQNFFNEDYQVAYVVDPIQNIEGFYFWINGKIEKCKGFYIYDKTGKNISVDVENNEPTRTSVSSSFDFKTAMLIILSVIVVFLIFANISVTSNLTKLEEQQSEIVSSSNQSFSYMHQLIETEAEEIERLESKLNDISAVFESLPPEETTEEGMPDDQTIDTPDEPVTGTIKDSEIPETSQVVSPEESSEITAEIIDLAEIDEEG